MNAQQNSGNFFLGLWLAIGLVVSAVFLTNAYKSVHSIDQTITVKGYAEKDITSDLAVWRLSFSGSGFDMQSAYSVVERDRQTVMNWLKSNGIDTKAVRIEPVYSRANYALNSQGYQTNEIISYTIDQTLVVTSNDVNKIDGLASESSDLISLGVVLYSAMPQYSYTKLDDLKIEMLGAATADARVRAEEIANNSGSSIGKLINAKQGVFQITPQNSTEVSDYGMYDLTSIEKSIKAVVTIEYTIK